MTLYAGVMLCWAAPSGHSVLHTHHNAPTTHQSTALATWCLCLHLAKSLLFFWVIPVLQQTKVLHQSPAARKTRKAAPSPPPNEGLIPQMGWPLKVHTVFPHYPMCSSHLLVVDLFSIRSLTLNSVAYHHSL